MSGLSILLTALFLAIGCAAAGIVAWPVLRSKGAAKKGKLLLAGALTLAVFGIGGGAYLMLGQPQLALRTLRGSDDMDPNALIERLARHMVESPGDVRGWTLLGRAYLSMRDPDQAAKAFAQGLSLQKAPDPDLLAAYGEALVVSASGAVTADAEKAFQAVIAADPKNESARYYLGLADMQHGKPDEAMAKWQALVDSMRADDALRSFVLDRLAQLKGQSGGNVDIQAMVDGLAARLKVEPHDGDGWRRLVRAYSVLGETEKAKAALADGRAALAADASARQALEDEARELKLN